MKKEAKTKLFICALFAYLLTAIGISAQSKKIESVYTDLSDKSCKTLEQTDEGAGWYRGECKGIGGYKLQITEGDIRQSIDVIAPNKKKTELDFTGKVSTAFSSVGAKAEWRVARRGKTITPIALIVRFDASENPENSNKTTSYLVVTKFTSNKICITDVVKPGANANETARRLADSSADKTCKAANN